MKTITLPDGRQLTYELTRKRVKNINFRAKENGIVLVSANSRASVAEIEKYLTRRADFFFDAFLRLREQEQGQKSRITVRSAVWLGREYPVRIIQSSRECAIIDESEIRVFTMLGGEPEHVLELVRKAVDTRFFALCEELNGEVRAELLRRGFKPPPTRVAIKDMKSRWGSCTAARGHISINRRLSAYPRESVLAVFWHEYTHYWHQDHSRKFYDMLLGFYPEYHKWHDVLKGTSKTSFEGKSA